MRCDLHVHTVHSGMCTIPVIRRFCRESYSAPEAVYETLKRRGMDLVTVTDHDSLEGAAALAGRPDFFPSVEVTCRMPSGTELHVGVYGLDERQYVEIRRRRDDVPSLAAYLAEQRLFFSANHIFSVLTGRRIRADFDWIERLFPALETLNAALPYASNQPAAALALRNGKIAVGGSDAHTLASLGLACTEVPGARSKAEFLEGLRQGRCRVRGEYGSYWKLTREVLTIIREMMLEQPWTALLAPLVTLVPPYMLGHHLAEAAFAHRWGWELGRGRSAPSADTVPAAWAAREGPL